MWLTVGLQLRVKSSYLGRPISVSCAFTGRMAVAYRRGEIMAAKDNPRNKYVNLYVGIYECESTGKTTVIVFIGLINTLCR